MTNRDDPRFRRTRAQLHDATRTLLRDRAEPLTFARIAQTAEVNRSTVHQHYGDLNELICDAFSADLQAISEPLDDCAFEDPTHTPPQLVAMFTRAQAKLELIDCLTPTGSLLVSGRLRAVLTTVLTARFTHGSRPPGFDEIPAEAHASYIAGGLTALLSRVDERSDPTRLADQAWHLITSPIGQAPMVDPEVQEAPEAQEAPAA